MFGHVCFGVLLPIAENKIQWFLWMDKSFLKTLLLSPWGLWALKLGFKGPVKP